VPGGQVQEDEVEASGEERFAEERRVVDVLDVGADPAELAAAGGARLLVDGPVDSMLRDGEIVGQRDPLLTVGRDGGLLRPPARLGTPAGLR
jgi:hypothetical protein